MPFIMDERDDISWAFLRPNNDMKDHVEYLMATQKTWDCKTPRVFGELFMAMLTKAMDQSEVYEWDPHLLKAAVYNATLFAGTTPSENCIPQICQWWHMKNNDAGVLTPIMKSFIDRYPNVAQMVPHSILLVPRITLPEDIAANLLPTVRRADAPFNMEFETDEEFLSKNQGRDVDLYLTGKDHVALVLICQPPSRPRNIYYIFSCPYVSADGVTIRKELLSCYVAAGLAFIGQPFISVRKFHTGKKPSRIKRSNPRNESYNHVTLRHKDIRDPRGLHDKEIRSYGDDCCWSVRGHWRHLNSPRKNDGATITWVSPFVKGNLEAPMKPVRETIFAVKR